MALMTRDLFLRRKWTLRAHDHQVVFVKRRLESVSHVMIKALLWALYVPLYPEIIVERAIDDRYKPDLVSLDRQGRPIFWGEAGKVGAQKIESLARRYRRTHFAIAKWDQRLVPLAELVSDALRGVRRDAPFDLISFPADSAERFIDERGEIVIDFEDIEWLRVDGV
jgi:hypothetical protein